MKISKNIYILALTISVVFAGCEKILEPKITSQLNAADFPKTEADIKAAFVPLYAQFNTAYGSTNPSAGNNYEFSFNAAYLGYNWATSISTDEAYDLYSSPYSIFTLAPATFQSTNGQSFYNRIRFVAKATDLIASIQNSNINNKDANIAEVKGLRAWFMFVLFDLYGPLNVKVDPTTLTSNVIEPRLTNADYVNAMEKDLLDAINGLPDKYNGTANWGRISKGVARMILLKLYMHEKQWPKAKLIAQDLMSMGYGIQSSYKNVFITPQNNEVIYAVPGNDGTNSVWFKCIIPADASEVLGMKVQVNNYKLVEMPWTYYDKYTPGDKRLETIANSYKNTSGTTISRNNGLSGAIPMKYVNYRPDEKGFDYVLYRYSDVVLSMAEILNEINLGPTTESIGLLKQITDRANTTASIPPAALLSYDSFKAFILAERGRELYWEFGVRRQDLIRNGSYTSSARNRGLNYVKDTQTLWPIPSDVIIQSDNKISQNIGY